MAETYAIWGRKEGRCLNIKASPARNSPLPYGAILITTVERCDRNLMLEWCREQVRKGWTIGRMRRACGEET